MTEREYHRATPAEALELSEIGYRVVAASRYADGQVSLLMRRALRDDAPAGPETGEPE